jgi:hypothetical protein
MNGKVVTRGVASPRGFFRKNHSRGFDEARRNALGQRDFDGKAYANKELLVIYSVRITPNPGGVGEYVVELAEKGHAG